MELRGFDFVVVTPDVAGPKEFPNLAGGGASR